MIRTRFWIILLTFCKLLGMIVAAPFAVVLSGQKGIATAQAIAIAGQSPQISATPSICNKSQCNTDGCQRGIQCALW